MTGVTTRRVRSTLLGYALLAPSLFGEVCFLLLPVLVVALILFFESRDDSSLEGAAAPSGLLKGA